MCEVEFEDMKKISSST